MRMTIKSILFAILLSMLSGCYIVRAVIPTQKVVEFSVADYTNPEKCTGSKVMIYQPMTSKIEGEDSQWLNKYAPILVQGVQEKRHQSYIVDSDRIGTPHLKKQNSHQYSVLIDTTEPVMYFRVEREYVHETWIRQLVYEFWYPRKPVGGIEKGDVDGGVLRITLDSGNRPIVYEYTQSCGCFHGIFVSEHVEQWAKKSWKTTEDGKQYFIEKKFPGRTDWVVRGIVKHSQNKERPILFISAGHHELKGLQNEFVSGNWDSYATQQYSLHPYQELESLSVYGETDATTASMFNDNGLVWGGQRSGEEVVFSGMDHPGWPRHLDKLKIHWDEADWNAPKLIDDYLRIPKQVVNPNALAPKVIGHAISDSSIK